jgi:hypothetical protein
MLADACFYKLYRNVSMVAAYVGNTIAGLY